MIIWNRAQESLNVYNIHSSWRHLRSKSTFGKFEFLCHRCADAIAHCDSESPYMNVDFYTHGGELLHQNVLRIFGIFGMSFSPGSGSSWDHLGGEAIYGLKYVVMVRPKSNGVQYGVDGWQSRKVLFVSFDGHLIFLIRVVRKGSLLAQPQSVLNFWDVCDWFRFIIPAIFKQRCNVIPAWCVVCTIREICANIWDLCDDSDGIWAFPGYIHSDWALHSPNSMSLEDHPLK